MNLFQPAEQCFVKGGLQIPRAQAHKEVFTKTVRELLAHKADKQGFTKMIRELFAHNADVHALIPDVALRMAAHYGYTEAVRVLLEHKADVHAHGWDGPDDALRRSSERGYTEMVLLLLEHKADVHACDGSGESNAPLRCAAVNGHAETVCNLLQAGANVRLCPSPFIDKYLNVSLDFDVSKVGFGVRLGVRVLREMSARTDVSFRMENFERARVQCRSALMTASFCFNSRDLCDCVLSYA